MRFTDFVGMEIESLEARKANYLRILEQSDDRNLYYRRKKGAIRYYWKWKGDTVEHYVSLARDGELIKQLQAKRNAEKRLKMVEQQIFCLKKLLKEYREDTNFNCVYGYNGVDVDECIIKKYEESKNPINKDHLRYDTGLGFSTRSKAELVIARILHNIGADFSYEEPLVIKNWQGMYKTVYPDFTIRLPSGKVVYIEYAGMFSNEGYRTHFFDEITEYFINGIMLGKNLYVIMEGKDGELDYNKLEKLFKFILTL